MSSSTAWWRLVAAREVTTRVRDKTFLISTAVLLLLVLGGIVVGTLVGGGPARYDVAVTEPSGARLAAVTEDQLRALPGEGDSIVEVTEVDQAAAARYAVDAEEVDAALLPTGDGFEIVGRDEVPGDLAAAAQSGLSLLALQENAQEAGTTVETLTAGSTLSQTTTAEGAVSADAAAGIAFVMALLFFVTAIGFGLAIAQSVVVEKENRIVEILAATVPLRALLWGKVLGNSLLALAQVLAVALAAVVGLLVLGAEGLDMIPAVGVAGLWFLAFVVGFLALASLWSVAGSLATRQEDLQSTTLPGQMLLLIPYLIAVTGSDRAIEISSFVPIASSMTMPARLVDGDVALWQPVVSLALSAAGAVLLIRLGARWYERSLLQTSRRTTYRELLRRQRTS
ncbi:MAG: ABC transporter permease [Propionibacteriales bacterium]|jgi:ABC-2 type transport system permease protein|nr:ABC transporter permease [Propionibacteriales bacterium]